FFNNASSPPAPQPRRGTSSHPGPLIYDPSLIALCANVMKLEDFLMQTREEHRRRCELEEEVAELQGVLDKEERLSRILQCALHAPLLSRSCLSSLLPPQVQVLLAELSMVEEEIIYLERKVDELRFSLRGEKKQTEELKLRHSERWLRQRRGSFFCRLGRAKDGAEAERHFLVPETSPSSRRLIKGRTVSLGSISEVDVALHTSSDADVERSKHIPDQRSPTTQSNPDEANRMETPNELSEELVRCLISIFHRLNQTANNSRVCHDSDAIISKFSLSCMSSKGITSSKSSFNCKTPVYSSDDTMPMLDPHGLLPDLDGTVGERGPYKNFVSVTESSLDMSRISQCFLSIRRLRVLTQKLCTADLTFLTYKQKLAFWINIYNACIMNAFLRHELPSSSDKVLALLNRAAMNVGGIILNALAIEHFILRHPCNSKIGGIVDEKEALLRDTYGLSYPEPNVTFALCRGTWSSPALRIYTGDNVVDQLETAKKDYLEASVQITNKKRILLPQLLYWHMKDFADDVESLVEWIYSQLPRSGSLKKSIMECLKSDTKLPVAAMVEVQPYESEFRYLLPYRTGLLNC
ncbi:hypothetical protein Taro_019580, partial [Colocasia esculenta]|nr:hypothetical protein [Colocasia esculenta]